VNAVGEHSSTRPGLNLKPAIVVSVSMSRSRDGLKTYTDVSSRSLLEQIVERLAVVSISAFCQVGTAL